MARRVAVCTAVYPAGSDFFDDYLRGLRKAIERFRGEVVVLFMCDGVDVGDVQNRAVGLGAALHAVRASGNGVAAVRREMLCAAANLPIDAVVCFDMDDIPLEEGLNLHWVSLERSEVSFGDMSLIDDDGTECGESFFSGVDVPEKFETAAELLNRNFMGFTNTAISRNVVLSSAEAIPDDVVAADWWFFNDVMNAGSVAQRTDGRVVSYRTHGSNTLGGKNPQGIDALKRVCKIMRRHYERLAPGTSVDAAVARIAFLQQRLV